MSAVVTFGRTDPLHLTERFAEKYGVEDYAFLWPFTRPCPAKIGAKRLLVPITHVWSNQAPPIKAVYCGTGATMFEALLIGCEVYVISSPDLDFQPAFCAEPQYDHMLKPVYWNPQTLARMFEEIRSRR